MEDFKYLVVEFWEDEDGTFTHKWLCKTLEEARHLGDELCGHTIIYKLEPV